MEVKYLLLIKKRKSLGSYHWNYSKTFTKYSNDMDDIYWNIDDCNPNKKRKISIVFDDIWWWWYA